MAVLEARYKPGVNVPAFAKTLVAAGHFVKLVDDKTADGAYQVGHCGLGERAFGVSEVDSGPTSQSAHSVERLVNVCRRGAIARVVPGAALTAGDIVQSDATGQAIPLDAEVAASLDTGVVANNNAIRWTAKDPGADGNLITVTIVDPGGTTAALGVVVTGPSIVVNLGRAASAINSTAADVIAAIEADTDANALVSVVSKSTSTGAGLMAAVSVTNLAGGANSTPPGAGVALGMACADCASDAAFAEIDLF
jgi:hypothetical protein